MSLTYPTIQIYLNTGNVITFSGASVISATVVEEVDPVSVEMPVSTLEFVVINKNAEFSIFNPSMSGSLKEKVPINVFEKLNEEQLFIGKFYLSKWKHTTNDKVEFTAVDIIGVLEDTEFDGVFWNTPTSIDQAVSQLFSAIGVPYELSNDLVDKTVSGWIKPSTYRYALQQICFAAQLSASTARRENLFLEPVSLPNKLRDHVVTRKTARQNNIDLTPAIASIEIVSHNYSAGLDEQVVFERYLDVGEHKVVFDAPFYDIVIDGVGYVPAILGTEDGLIITTESLDYIEAGGDFTLGSNAVYFHMTIPGTVVIRGKPWIDNKKAFTHHEPGAGISTNRQRLAISDATLVDSSRAPEILESLKDFYRLRYTQDLMIMPSKIKSGDIVVSDALHGNRIIAFVRKSVLNLSGGFLSNAVLVGQEPGYIPAADNPVRRPRTGIAICGSGKTRTNKWRQYA